MNPHLRPDVKQLLHYQWFRLQPAVREAARAAHYKMWGSLENFPILSHEDDVEEAGMGQEGQEDAVEGQEAAVEGQEAAVEGQEAGLGLGGQEAELGRQEAGMGRQEAGMDENFASLLRHEEQIHGPWRTEEEERRQEQEIQENLGALQPVLGDSIKEVAREVEGGEPITRQKSGIKQRLRPRRHSVTDSLQSGGKRKAVAEDRNEVFQAVMSRKRRKSEAQPSHTGREGGRRGRRRSTGVR